MVTGFSWFCVKSYCRTCRRFPKKFAEYLAWTAKRRILKLFLIIDDLRMENYPALHNAQAFVTCVQPVQLRKVAFPYFLMGDGREK